MKAYKIEAIFMDGYLLTAVVACENVDDCLALCGWDGEDYSKQSVVCVGERYHLRCECCGKIKSVNV